MDKAKILSATILAVALFTQAGCAPNSQQPTDNTNHNQEEVETPAAEQQAEQQAMSQFSDLITHNPDIAEVVEFMKEHLSEISPQNMSEVIIAFENLQKSYLPTFEEKFYSDNQIQQKFWNLYLEGIDFNEVDSIPDDDVKSLVEEAITSGYKIETAEGMYFPIIDYEFYKTFSTNATADIEEYIAIMAIESNQVPAKDAALIISWDEIVNRALRQEQFLSEYPESTRFNEISALYNSYKMYTLFGLNNTPLFGYDDHKISNEAKVVYEQAIGTDEISEYVELLREFIDILEKNDYRLTDEVDVYRKEVVDFPS